MRAERLTDDNASAFWAIEIDANFVSGLGGIQSDKVITLKIQRNIVHWAEHRFGLWIKFDKVGHQVGRGTIRSLTVDGETMIELGYALMPTDWLQGLATELLSKFTALARQMCFKELFATILPENGGSLAVADKAGFKFDCEYEHYGQPFSLYKPAIL